MINMIQEKLPMIFDNDLFNSSIRMSIFYMIYIYNTYLLYVVPVL